MSDFYARMGFLFGVAHRSARKAFNRFFADRKKIQAIVVLIMLVEWMGSAFAVIYLEPFFIFSSVMSFPAAVVFTLSIIAIFAFFYSMLTFYTYDIGFCGNCFVHGASQLFFVIVIALVLVPHLHQVFLTFYPVDAQVSTAIAFAGFCLVLLLLGMCLSVGLFRGALILIRAYIMHRQGRGCLSDTSIHMTFSSSKRVKNAEKIAGTRHCTIASRKIETILQETLQEAMQTFSAPALLRVDSLLQTALKKNVSLFPDDKLYGEDTHDLPSATLNRKEIYFHTDKMLFDYKDYIALKQHAVMKQLSAFLDKIFAVKHVCHIKFWANPAVVSENFEFDKRGALDWLRGPYYYKVGMSGSTFARKLLGLDAGQRAMPFVAVCPMVSRDWLFDCGRLCQRMVVQYTEHLQVAKDEDEFAVFRIAERLAWYYLHDLIYRFAERVVRSRIAPSHVITHWSRQEDLGLNEDVVGVIVDFSRDSSVLYDTHDAITTFTF